MTERVPFLWAGPRAVLLRRIRNLTVDDLHALDAAVGSLILEKTHRHVDKGFLYAWWEGPRLQDEEDQEMQELFSAVLAALAGGLTDIDVERFGARLAPKPTGLGSISQLFFPPSQARRIQDASIGLIEDAVAPWNPRRAVVAIWNMACAAALRDHLSPATITTLQAAWRRALGDPPI
jgi:hypothetical protein